MCMRSYVINQIVAVGMTAFFSMLFRQENGSAQKTKHDLELRRTISQLHQLAFDQFTLCLSFVLGRFSSYQKCTSTQTSGLWDTKLYSSYNSSLHMLRINKKIPAIADFQVFDSAKHFCTNEASRDHLLSQWTLRFQEVCMKMLSSELEIQQELNNTGNANLI